jgi:hypothetical protein
MHVTAAQVDGVKASATVVQQQQQQLVAPLVAASVTICRNFEVCWKCWLLEDELAVSAGNADCHSSCW